MSLSPHPANPTLRFWAVGNWCREQIHCDWRASSQRIPQSVQDQIDALWTAAQTPSGGRLFDGPLCRLERLHASPSELRLHVAPGRYKQFWGVQKLDSISRAHRPAEMLSFPVGVSAAVCSRDDRLVLGRRGTNVAFYPERLHPFAGAVEPTDGDQTGAAAPDLFAAALRELSEELNVAANEIADMRCVALLEDPWLCQPELVFLVQTHHTAANLEARLDPAEHVGLFVTSLTPDALSQLARQPELTPVAAGAALLWGREMYGTAWFDEQCASIPLEIEWPTEAWPGPR